MTSTSLPVAYYKHLQLLFMLFWRYNNNQNFADSAEQDPELDQTRPVIVRAMGVASETNQVLRSAGGSSNGSAYSRGLEAVAAKWRR